MQLPYFPCLIGHYGSFAWMGNHGSLHILVSWTGAPTNLVRVPGRKDTLEGSNKRSNPNLGETVILTQGRTASPLGLSDINGTGIYLKVMRVHRRLTSTPLY